MLSQINFWAERAGMLLDLVLMLRIVMLKLSRTYVFIALFALLTLFYDGVALWLGSETPEFLRVYILSKFIYAILFPLVTWDLFEEAKPSIDKMRRTAMSRMIGSLLFISLWGMLIAAFTGGEDNGQSFYLMRLALVVWTGSVAAALAFLWVMRRGVKASQLQLPRNTSTWFRYFQLILVVEAVSCALYLILPSLQGVGNNLPATIEQASYPVLQLSDILLTGWCVYHLRSVPTDASNVPADVNP